MKKSIVISLLAVTILFCTALYSLASTGIVTTDTLRLRKDASVEASIVGLLSMDDKVTILEEKNGWYKVKAKVEGENLEGYVSAKYVKIKETSNKVENNTIKEEEKKAEEEKTETKENNNNESTENKVMVKTLPSATKLRITPVINSIVLNTLSEDKIIEVISEINDWSYITIGDIKGWVRSEDIVEKEALDAEQNISSQKTGYISSNSVNFRKEATTSSDTIIRLLKNTKVSVISEKDGWTKILYNGNVGYVASNYVSDKKIITTSRSGASKKAATNTKTTSTKNESQAKTEVEKEENTEIGNNSSAKGAEIVAYAKQFLGSKYVHGGSSPSGFDCSGFTSYVYKHFGYSLNRVAANQSSNGRPVSKSNLQQGDIICFANSRGGKIGHVGIYIGGGKFIHAANARKGVIISNVDGAGFYYVCARRII